MRERDRDRDRETDRQTDRDRDREKDRQTKNYANPPLESLPETSVLGPQRMTALD